MGGLRDHFVKSFVQEHGGDLDILGPAEFFTSHAGDVWSTPFATSVGSVFASDVMDRLGACFAQICSGFLMVLYSQYITPSF